MATEKTMQNDSQTLPYEVLVHSGKKIVFQRVVIASSTFEAIWEAAVEWARSVVDEHESVEVNVRNFTK